MSLTPVTDSGTFAQQLGLQNHILSEYFKNTLHIYCYDQSGSTVNLRLKKKPLAITLTLPSRPDLYM